MTKLYQYFIITFYLENIDFMIEKLSEKLQAKSQYTETLDYLCKIFIHGFSLDFEDNEIFKNIPGFDFINYLTMLKTALNTGNFSKINQYEIKHLSMRSKEGKLGKNNMKMRSRMNTSLYLRNRMASNSMTRKLHSSLENRKTQILKNRPKHLFLSPNASFQF